MFLEKNGCDVDCPADPTASIWSEKTIQKLDPHKLLLMGSVLLFSADETRFQVERPDLIEKLQTHLLILLQRYLIFRFGYNEAIKELARAVDIISMFQEECLIMLPVEENMLCQRL